MNQLAEPIQTPAPGTQRLMFRGDTITFTLAFAQAVQGRAWIRTTIGHAATARRTVINQVLHDIQPLGEEWYDIPMERQDDRNFAVTMPLNEVGHFEAKCFFLAGDRSGPTWPPGPDTVINVEPADTCAANIIYNAFVRQFGPNKDGSARPGAADRDCIERLDRHVDQRHVLVELHLLEVLEGGDALHGRDPPHGGRRGRRHGRAPPGAAGAIVLARRRPMSIPCRCDVAA
ncbi:MAG: hypothetical protein ACOC3F_00170, partial [Desulfosudaceae bacterium]